MKKFVLAHGFGFDNSYWKNLRPMLDGEIYYHETSKLNKNDKYIGIGHSLGFYKLNNSGLNFSHLICLQGFLNFCGNDHKLRFIREQFLSRFIRSFESNQLLTMHKFYESCGYDGRISIAKKSDLFLMKESSVHCGIETVVIYDIGDNIVSKTIIHDNFNGLSNITTKCIDENVNHVLGYKKPEIVIEAINELTNKR